MGVGRSLVTVAMAGGGDASADGGGGGPPSAVAAVADTKPATRVAETRMNSCGGQFAAIRWCVADALDAYADSLRDLALPAPLRGLPEIVARAAHRVRVARTSAEATKAIKTAIAEVHKEISLLKADDPSSLTAEIRAGSFVAETLEVADNDLERAIGL